MKMNHIYASISRLLEMPSKWTTIQLKTVRIKSQKKGSSTTDWVRFIDNMIFSLIQITFLVISLSKLQRLIKIFGEFKIRKKLLLFEPKNSKSHTEPPKKASKIRKVVIFALYSIEYKIIEWRSLDLT